MTYKLSQDHFTRKERMCPCGARARCRGLCVTCYMAEYRRKRRSGDAIKIQEV